MITLDVVWTIQVILIFSADVKRLATRLMNEDDYKMKCVDYFQSLTDDCGSVELEFPYFNLLFLVQALDCPRLPH